jgi:methyl-accepting chemotaxis protein
MRASVSWRRRQLVVEGFQTRFIATQLAWLVFFLFAFAIVLLAPQVYVLLSNDKERRLEAAVVFLSLHQQLWPALAVFLAIATAVTIRQSHRIAGPLYRFRRVCEEVAAGRLFVSARIRRGDYLTREAEAFEAMLVALRTRIATAQASLEQADEHLRTMKALENSSVEVERIEELVGHARQSLDVFEVTAHRGASSMDR